MKEKLGQKTNIDFDKTENMNSVFLGTIGRSI